MKQRVIIAAGGTGGHLFPAIRLANSLRELDESLIIHFIGGGLDNSPFFDRSLYPYTSVKCYPWKGLSIKSVWNLLSNNFTGLKQSISAIRSFKPDAVIGFGSFHTLPVITAALLYKTPLFQYEANSIPGKVVKLFSNYAQATAVQFPTASNTIKGNTVQVAMSGKYPDVDKQALRGQARDYFCLDANKKTLLIAGGSQGAETMNGAIVKQLTSIQDPHLQVIHLLGKGADLEKYKEAYSKTGIKASVKNFEERMDLAWSAADLFIGRSGAGTVAELLQTETASLLIPYPFASDDHQTKNAQFMSQTVEGGNILCQEDLLSEKFKELLYRGLSQQNHSASRIGKYKAEQNLPTMEEAALEFLKKIRS